MSCYSVFRSLQGIAIMPASDLNLPGDSNHRNLGEGSQRNNAMTSWTRRHDSIRHCWIIGSIFGNLRSTGPWPCSYFRSDRRIYIKNGGFKTVRLLLVVWKFIGIVFDTNPPIIAVRACKEIRRKTKTPRKNINLQFKINTETYIHDVWDKYPGR